MAPACRDSVMREEEARASAAAFEERAGKALKVLEKGLGLMQHKVGAKAGGGAVGWCVSSLVLWLVLGVVVVWGGGGD